MCGIVAQLGKGDMASLEAMSQEIRHRGPDQEGVWVGDNVLFRHVRLSILDLSEAGRQPMMSADGRFIIIYNGEIYNYQALRQKYQQKGWKFQSQSDTECLLASAALCRLEDLWEFNGMFAFVLWDRTERCAWVARDRTGIKPLFFSEQADVVTLASEIPAFLKNVSGWELDREALSTFFAIGYVSGDRTMLKHIHPFPPGALWQWKEGVWASKASFVQSVPTSLPADYEEAKFQLESALDDAVHRQLISDRPVGVFLSGGLDSSAILSSVRRARPSGELHTFTTRFRHQSGDAKFNADADLAKLTAQKFECTHHEIEVSTEDVIRESESIARHLGQPHGNVTVAAVDAASRLASSWVKVVLLGDGGDELFGGYARYRMWSKASPWISRAWIRKSALFVSQWIPPWKERYHDLLSASTEAGWLLSFHAASQLQRRSWYPGLMDDSSIKESWNRILTDISEKNSAKRFMALDRKTWLSEDALARADRLTMRHGIEARVPILDDEVQQFALGLPSEWLFSGRSGKRIWREAFQERILTEVHNAPKRGWYTPTSKWLREGLYDWAASILEEACTQHSWISREVVLHAFSDHVNQKGYFVVDLWNIIAFQLWWRQFGSHCRDV